MINAFRRFLIRLGKALPFILCSVVFISYIESAFALYMEDYLEYNGYLTLNTPISFKLASIFEYDMLTIFAATILSISIETCVWNRLSLAYLAIHLLSRRYIEAQELYPEYIYIICIINIALCGFFCYKGVKILLR